MTHELLWTALDAQSANASLSGRDLRSAAEELLRLHTPGRTVLMAVDAAGERIIGAAMTLTDQPVEVFDYTHSFPARSTCLLVGGFIAGPVGVADAAAAVIGAGATRVQAAVIGGWSDPIDGVARVRNLGRQRARVA
jgi:hypothetical protein